MGAEPGAGPCRESSSGAALARSTRCRSASPRAGRWNARLRQIAIALGRGGGAAGPGDPCRTRRARITTAIARRAGADDALPGGRTESPPRWRMVSPARTAWLRCRRLSGEDAAQAERALARDAASALCDSQCPGRRCTAALPVRDRLHARLAAARADLLHRKLHRRACAPRAWSRLRSGWRCSAATRASRVASRRRRGSRSWDGGGAGSSMGIAGCLGLRIAHRAGRDREHRRPTSGSRSTNWSRRSIAGGSVNPRPGRASKSKAA